MAAKTTMSFKPQTRSIAVERSAINEESRTVELAFSSEFPVERYFGVEILDHSPGSVRLSRLANGGAVLVDHNTRDQVGVVESVSIDQDRRGRVLVRLGKGARASEIFQDLIDGIRRHVSVGYLIHKAVIEERGKDGQADKYRVTDWEPYEVSIVSVPADPTVGIGRSADPEETQAEVTVPEAERQEPENPQEERDMPQATTATPAFDVNAEREAIRQSEIKRCSDINGIAEKFGHRELAAEFVKTGRSVDEFRAAIIERMTGAELKPAGDAKIGMEKRDVERYSFNRLLNALANPNDRSAQSAAGYELELSSAAAQVRGKETRGVLVPQDVLEYRDMTVGTAANGGNLVATELLSGSFIEKLENAMVIKQLGATVLTGLNGNIAIPRQTGGVSTYWLAEGGTPTKSDPTFDQVAMTPKTIAAITEISRRLLIQSSIGAENFTRNDILTRLALGIDLAAINGSGAGNQPRGILNQSGIGAVVGGTNGAAPSWANIVALETEVAVDNAALGKLAYLTNTKVRGKLKTTEKFVNGGREIWEGGNSLNGYPAAVSNQVPGNLTKGTAAGICSSVIFGNWAELIMAFWGGLDLTVDPYSNSTSGAVRIVAFQDADLAVRHAESFAAMLDALTA